MKRLMVGMTVLTLAIVACMGMSLADDEGKPKYTIKEVMKRCMKGGLCKKVAGGDASDDEKKELLVMFQALGKNEPPKGDAESWNEKTNALAKAAQAVVDGKEGAGGQLRKAANCGACHKAHKGK